MHNYLVLLQTEFIGTHISRLKQKNMFREEHVMITLLKLLPFVLKLASATAESIKFSVTF
jgi:hypothetical protein